MDVIYFFVKILLQENVRKQGFSEISLSLLIGINLVPSISHTIHVSLIFRFPNSILAFFVWDIHYCAWFACDFLNSWTQFLKIIYSCKFGNFRLKNKTLNLILINNLFTPLTKNNIYHSKSTYFCVFVYNGIIIFWNI